MSGAAISVKKRIGIPNPEKAPSSEDLASFFECPVCYDYVLPPIFQCQAGHLACATCRPQLVNCPTCRGPMGNIRNLAMERVACAIFFPCKNTSAGCKELMLYKEKVQHEKVCEWRPYVCPCPGTICKWQGSLAQVMSHLKSTHSTITTLQGDDIVFLATDINLAGAVDWVMMQSCYGRYFMLVLEKQQKKDVKQYYAVVQLVGSRKQASKYTYKLELRGTDGRRRLTWEATTLSIQDSVTSAIEMRDCLVFDGTIAQLFADGEGNLALNVTISMEPFHGLAE